MNKPVRRHEDLEVYRLSFELAMEIFDISKGFPADEKYSLTGQIRRSSRSVSANIAEAFRKRRYPKSFILKLSDSETEAAETQVWLEFAFSCKYISPELYKNLYLRYDQLMGKIINMMNTADKWKL
jgi:four helix bundle protein